MVANSRDVDDRLVLRQLVEAYASGCDRRDFDAVTGLFTEAGRLAIYRHDGELTREGIGRQALRPMLAGLARYDATTHFLGQQSTTIDMNRATGETYCLAHHVYRRGQRRWNRVMSIRYWDTYCRSDSRWFFEDRSLFVDWIEYRPMAGPGVAPPWARRVDEAYLRPR